MPIRYAFFSRLLETGATVSGIERGTQMGLNIQLTSETAKEMLHYITSMINWIWFRSDEFLSSLRPAFSDDGMRVQNSIDNLRMEFRSLTVAVDDLHLKHRLLASNLQIHRDRNVQFKAEKKHLEDIKSELEENNSKLASLEAQNVEMVRKEQKEIQDMEALLKELMDLVASRIVEISNLHGRITEISKKLVNLKNVLVDFKGISSSRAFSMLKDQVDKSKMELEKYQILLKKLQVEKDKFLLREKTLNIAAIRVEINEELLEILKPLIDELEQELPKLFPDCYRLSMVTKLEEISREPSRKVVFQDFKNSVSSHHKEMRDMQNESDKLEDSSSEIHSLRSQVQSLSALLQREAYKLQSLFDKSAGQHLEIKNLHLVSEDLKKTELELKVFLEMHRRESTESWDVMESRDMERKALAQVQSLKSSLDEHNLKSHVKTVLEPESLTQQRLVTVEAEIADLRQNLEITVREKAKSSEKLNSLHEDCESYLCEIEGIRGAFEEMQIENQELLQQIIDRDEQIIEVVITNCYHLFCRRCIQKTIGSRRGHGRRRGPHLKCPTCSKSFLPNDVKPIYL